MWVTVLRPESSATQELYIAFFLWERYMPNANMIVNEPSLYESIAVVCVSIVSVQSVGPISSSFVLKPEFALISCYQDCADMILMCPQSVRARWRESLRANVSGNIRHISVHCIQSLLCEFESHSKDGLVGTMICHRPIQTQSVLCPCHSLLAHGLTDMFYKAASASWQELSVIVQMDLFWTLF